MPYSTVDSAFLVEMTKSAPSMSRKFIIGTSDYSDKVTRWPSFKKSWNELKPQMASIDVVNESGAFDFIQNNPANLNTECKVQVGVEYDSGSTNLLDLFVGKLSRVSYNKNKLTLRITDKFKAFTERVVGTNDAPVDFTTSNHNPADMAWILITCYGGLDSTASTANAEIDYQAWSDWKQIFTDDSVLVNGYIKGKKVGETVKIIGRITSSAIFEEEGKIKFARYSASSEAAWNIPSIKGATLDIDDSKIINKRICQAAYNVNSRAFGSSVFSTNTASVNSFGSRETLESNNVIWYTSSQGALNFVERELFINASPFENYNVSTSLLPIGRSIGDTVGFMEDYYGVANSPFRLMGYQIDLNKSTMKLNLNASQVQTFFVLDNASLGLLDQTYNPLG